MDTEKVFMQYPFYPGAEVEFFSAVHIPIYDNGMMPRSVPILDALDLLGDGELLFVGCSDDEHSYLLAVIGRRCIHLNEGEGGIVSGAISLLPRDAPTTAKCEIANLAICAFRELPCSMSEEERIERSGEAARAHAARWAH